VKALITGGAGFIGGHLAASLAAAGHRVDIVDNLARGVRDAFIESLVAGHHGRVRVVAADLLSPDALSEFDAAYDQIFHLAAIIGVQHVLARPYDVLAHNAAMTDRVLAFARRHASPPRVVFASTSEVYAGTLLQGTLPIPTPESAPLAVPPLGRPRTSYMLSKIYGEAMCHASGVPVTIVRPHNIYGPRMGLSHVIPELLKRAYEAPEGSDLEVFSADHRRTFCFIDDAVRQIRGVADAPAAAGVTVNIGSDGPEYTIAELAAVVVRTVGKRLRIVPGAVTAGSPTRRCPDTHLCDELSGHRTRVPLADGVSSTYAWYKNAVFTSGGASAV